MSVSHDEKSRRMIGLSSVPRNFFQGGYEPATRNICPLYIHFKPYIKNFGGIYPDIHPPGYAHDQSFSFQCIWKQILYCVMFYCQMVTVYLYVTSYKIMSEWVIENCLGVSTLLNHLKSRISVVVKLLHFTNIKYY
jgi:hypothetical protein